MDLHAPIDYYIINYSTYNNITINKIIAFKEICIEAYKFGYNELNKLFFRRVAINNSATDNEVCGQRNALVPLTASQMDISNLRINTFHSTHFCKLSLLAYLSWHTICRSSQSVKCGYLLVTCAGWTLAGAHIVLLTVPVKKIDI